MADKDEVLIRLPDGAEYAIDEKNFDKGDVDGAGHTYKDLKAKIVGYTNGDAYPRKEAKAAAEKPAEPAAS